MGPLGVPEMFAIFVIALLLFGPKKLPELGRTLGKALSEFRRAKNELKGTFESHLRELEREANVSEISSSASPNYSSHYSYPYEDYNQYNPESPDYSNPSPVGGTEEHAALPAAEDASRIEHAAPEHAAPPRAEAVSGTVARTNGTRPLDEHAGTGEHLETGQHAETGEHGEAAPTHHHVPQREEHPV